MLEPNYIVITPVRDEEKFLPLTIQSFAAQTVLPKQWILVDDGSTDGTPGILCDAAARYPWITVVRRANRGFRQAGGGVVEAFNEGYHRIQSDDWQFVAKFDGDLTFAQDFFEECLVRFAEDPKLGIGGGLICSLKGDELVEESPGDPPFHVRGATKFYRRTCWEQIGGYFPAPGWDTLDELKANQLGWRTRTFRELKLEHHRYAGGADGNWKNWVKNGRANYVSAYHPLFMLCKCAFRVTRKPVLVGACGLFWGFLSGYLLRMPRLQDRQLCRYVREQQLNRLLLKPSLWD